MKQDVTNQLYILKNRQLNRINENANEDSSPSSPDPAAQERRSKWGPIKKLSVERVIAQEANQGEQERERFLRIKEKEKKIT